MVSRGNWRSKEEHLESIDRQGLGLCWATLFFPVSPDHRASWHLGLAFTLPRLDFLSFPSHFLSLTHSLAYAPCQKNWWTTILHTKSFYVSWQLYAQVLSSTWCLKKKQAHLFANYLFFAIRNSNKLNLELFLFFAFSFRKPALILFFDSSFCLLSTKTTQTPCPRWVWSVFLFYPFATPTAEDNLW